MVERGDNKFQITFRDLQADGSLGCCPGGQCRSREDFQRAKPHQNKTANKIDGGKS